MEKEASSLMDSEKRSRAGEFTTMNNQGSGDAKKSK